MGRTLPSATQFVEMEKDVWKEFRRVLRKEDREVFDRLFSYAKNHSQALSNSSSLYPFEPIIISMLIELEKKISSRDSQ
jgi:hypothetical protein